MMTMSRGNAENELVLFLRASASPCELFLHPRRPSCSVIGKIPDPRKRHE
jgi:hypothetical protein